MADKEFGEFLAKFLNNDYKGMLKKYSAQMDAIPSEIMGGLVYLVYKEIITRQSAREIIEWKLANQ